VLLAVTIMGFISAVLFGSFTRTARIKQRTEAAQDRLHAARVAMMRMTREIEMAFLSNKENIGCRRSGRCSSARRTPTRRAALLLVRPPAAARRRRGGGHGRGELLLRARHGRPLDDEPDAPRDAAPRAEGPAHDRRRGLRALPGITRIKFQYYDYKTRNGSRSGTPWGPTASSTCPRTCA
jgi:hypothetical protein